MSRIEFLATPAPRGSFVTIDSEGESVIKFAADQTQLAKVLPLLTFEKGILLRIVVEDEP